MEAGNTRLGILKESLALFCSASIVAYFGIGWGGGGVLRISSAPGLRLIHKSFYHPHDSGNLRSDCDDHDFWTKRLRGDRRYRPATIAFQLLAAVLCISGVFACATSCAAQAVPPSDQWGERYNSPGATLSFKETERSLLKGKTVVTYNLFALGLPADGQYVLSTVILGATPIKMGEVRLTEEGKIVSATADPAHNIVAGEPVLINLLAPKGQPFQFAVVSADGRLHAFTRIIPFPIEADTGPCRLSVEEIMPAYAGILIRLSGLQSNETVVLKCKCGRKGYETKGTANDRGIFIAAVETSVKGKQSGTFEFELKAQSCKIGMQVPWGRGTEKFQ